mgnify:CR=1 FL=1
MRIKDLTVTYSRKQGMPNYGSMEYGAGMTIEVDEKQEIETQFRIAWLQVRSQVLTNLNLHLKPTPEIIKELDEINKEKLQLIEDIENAK